jgi:RNA polymerase sigma-70 factor (ECF subfamily)
MAAPAPVDELATVVAAARAGDREAFDELVRLTYRETLQLATRLAGNEQDARDIVQDAYLRAYRGLRRFRGDSRFRTWLFRITVNCASSHASRSRRHRHDQLTPEHQGALAGLPGDRADVEARADTLSLRADLEAALSCLPPKLRAVVVLRDVYDLSHDAIADELGISQAAAKVRLHRARQQLRERLYAYDERSVAAHRATGAAAPTDPHGAHRRVG